MELLSVLRARSIWLFDAYDLNPRGKNLGNEMIEWLKKSYNFSKVPSSMTDLDATNGLAFIEGTFYKPSSDPSKTALTREKTPLYVELRLYSDGFVADTRSSTADTDLFLENALASASRDLGITYDPAVIKRINYLSELNMRLEKPLNTINPKVDKIADKLASMVFLEPKSAFIFSGFGFQIDPALSVAKQLSGFVFERKAVAPFSENRYYSKAPLQTDQHLEILEDIERILLSNTATSSNLLNVPKIVME